MVFGPVHIEYMRAQRAMWVAVKAPAIRESTSTYPKLINFRSFEKFISLGIYLIYFHFF